MTIFPACRRDLMLYIKWCIIFFIIRTLLGVTRESFTQLLTLKESTGYFGVSSFACFHHQAHNIGLSKYVTISPKLGSDPEPWLELGHCHKPGLWPAGPVRRCLQNIEMKSTWWFLADPSECLTQGGRMGLFIHALANPFLPFIGSSGLWAANRSHKSFWVGLV